MYVAKFIPLKSDLGISCVNTTSYLIHKSHAIIIHFKTPGKVQSKRPTKYFGVRQHEGKLEPRELRCAFLGYREAIQTMGEGF